jgi:hypothetical protein
LITCQLASLESEPSTKGQGSFIKQENNLTLNEVFVEKKIPIFVKNCSLNRDKNNREINKILVVTPASTGNFLLKNLCRNGAKIIGLKEYNFMIQNHGYSVYPRDFVDTESSKQWHLERSLKHEQKFLRYPDNKKFNFACNNFSLPFGLNMNYFIKNDKSEFSNFRLCLLSKGTAQENALVFACQESDLTELIKKADYEGLYSFIMNFEESNDTLREDRVESERNFDQISNYKQFLEQETACKRIPIGQVTGAGFNYLKRRPSGSCYVLVDRFEGSVKIQENFFSTKQKVKSFDKYKKICKGLVLVRNPRSFDYHLGFVY